MGGMPDGSLALPAPKCGAKRTTKGPNGENQYCKYPAGYGTPHPGYGPCKRHFGNTPSQCANGVKAMIRDMARKAVEERGIDPDSVTPEQVITEELARSYAIVTYLEAHTDDAAIAWPDWQKVLLAERQHAVMVARAMLSAGIEERQVRVMEVQAQVLGGAVRAILDRLELTPDQRRQAPIIVRQVMSALPAA